MLIKEIKGKIRNKDRNQRQAELDNPTYHEERFLVVTFFRATTEGPKMASPQEASSKTPLLPQRREFPRALSLHDFLETLRIPEGMAPPTPLLPHRPKASGLHAMRGQVIGQPVPIVEDIGACLSIAIVKRTTNRRHDHHSP
jgi:hypothetical protein